MGLDMFLYVQTNDVELTEKSIVDETVTREEVAYWRKANMVHQYFCTRGKEISPSYLYTITREDLLELLKICHGILDETLSPEVVLPTTNGFFFGSVGYDEIYYDHIKETIFILSEVLLLNEKSKDAKEFIYLASW